MAEVTTQLGETEPNDFMALARERFRCAADDEKAIRDEAAKDLRFVAGEQWDPAIKQARIANGRPALTFPRCHVFVQRVSNEARQNKPQFKFSPGDGGDPDTAEVLEGMARQIQYSSEAQVAYETAVEYSAGGSFGYYGLTTEYCDDETNDLDLKVRTIVDPFAVYGILVPACFRMEPKHAFVVEDMPVAEYKRQFPKTDLTTLGFEEAGKRAEGWVSTETVRIAEYWRVEEEEATNKLGRKYSKRTVKYCKINGIEILPGTEAIWPGRRIPLYVVLGKTLIVSGKPYVFSVVRPQRDPQHLINVYKSRIAETLGTAPIQPFMVTPEQIAGFENDWGALNTRLTPYLKFHAQTIDGKPLGAPQRMVFEPPIQAYSEAAAQEIDDMKATAGIFDASLGQKSNETSGKGIQARQQQSDLTNMHYLDNLGRSFQESGTDAADIIPKIYDTERLIRILGKDEAPKIIKINGPFQDERGNQKHYKITSGKYDVVVTMGRSFSTKRMESFDFMMQLVQANPQLFNLIGDIMLRNSDSAGADQAADRLKKMLPPQLHDDGESDPKQQVAQLQAQLQQIGQQFQVAQQIGQQMQGEIHALQAEKQARVQDNQAKLEIVREQERTKILIAEIETKAQDAQRRAEMEQEQWKTLNGANLQQQKQAHDAAMAAAGVGHEAGMAQVSHEQALEQQDAAGQQAMMQAQQQAALNPPQAQV